MADSDNFDQEDAESSNSNSFLAAFNQKEGIK